MTTEPHIVHASAVAVAGRAALICGASGMGKSQLALQLMAYGATLIADDRVMLVRKGADIIAQCPPALRGMIEARGIGILAATCTDSIPVACMIDLDKVSLQRLPDLCKVTVLGCELPLLHPVAGINIAPAVMQFLRMGRIA